MGKALNIINRFSLDEMANLSVKKYGLPTAIWTSEMPKGKKGYARIKVASDYGQTVGISNSFVTLFDRSTAEFISMFNPKQKSDTVIKMDNIKKKDVKLIVEFISKYSSLFTRFWKQEIDEDQFKDTLLLAVKSGNPNADIVG